MALPSLLDAVALRRKPSRPRCIAFLETGIYIDSGFIPLPISDLTSPKLLIPWQEISRYEVIEDKKYSFYLGSPTITILTLSIEEVRELENLSGILISDRLDFA